MVHGNINTNDETSHTTSNAKKRSLKISDYFSKRRWHDSRSIKCLKCHKIAIDYETNLSRTCGNVWEMSSDTAKKTMVSNRICFIKVIECLQYLARQGQAMQGDSDDEPNFIQLLQLS